MKTNKEAGPVRGAGSWKTVQVAGFGDSGLLYQQVEVPGPGEPGYSQARLPESGPWAEDANPVMDAAEDDWYARWNAEHPESCPCNELEAGLWLRSPWVSGTG